MVPALVILTLLAAGVCLFWILRSTAGRPQSLDNSRPDSAVVASGIGDCLIQRESLTWMDVFQHIKLGEFLQISGLTVGGDPFIIVLQIQQTRKIDLLYTRAGAVSRRLDAGEQSMITIPQKSSLDIFTPGPGQIETRLLDNASETPQDFISDHPFSLVISNVASLKTGNSFHIAGKCGSLEVKFIKSWDMPARHADNALLADMSIKADLAHLAERLKDVQRASVSQMDGAGNRYSLRSGICYVLGQWGGDSLDFEANTDIALLVVENFDPSTKLSEFLNKLSLSPTMHTRLVNRAPAFGQAREPLLICPDPASGEHNVVRLLDSNAVLSLPTRSGSPVDVLKVRVDQDAANPAARGVRLTYLPSQNFQNVLVWRLSQGKSPEPPPRQTGPAIPKFQP